MSVSECSSPRLECAPCPPPQKLLDGDSAYQDIYSLFIEAATLANLTAEEAGAIRQRCGIEIPTTTTTTTTTPPPTTTTASTEHSTVDQQTIPVTTQKTMSTTTPPESEQNTTSDTPIVTPVSTNHPPSITTSFLNQTTQQTALTSSSAGDSTLNQTTFTPPSNTSTWTYSSTIPITVVTETSRESSSSAACRGTCIIVVIAAAVCLFIVLLSTMALLLRKRRETRKLERRKRNQQRPRSGIDYDSPSRFTDERSLYNNGPVLRFNFSDYSVAYDNPAYRQSSEFRTFGKTLPDEDASMIDTTYPLHQSDGNIFYTGTYTYKGAMPRESSPKLERRSKSLKPPKNKNKLPAEIFEHRRTHSMNDYVPKSLSQFSQQRIDGLDELIYSSSDRGRSSRIKSLESESSLERKTSKKKKSKKRKSDKRSRSYDPMLLAAYDSVPLENNSTSRYDFNNQTVSRSKPNVNSITNSLKNTNERSPYVTDYSGRERDYVRLNSTGSEYAVENKTFTPSYQSNTNVYYTEPRPRTPRFDRNPKHHDRPYNGHIQPANKGLPRISIDTDLDELFQRSGRAVPRDDQDRVLINGYYTRLDNDAPVHFPRNYHDNPDRVYVYHTKL